MPAVATKTAPHGKAAEAYRPALTIEVMPPPLLDMEYAVRGPIVIRANELEALKNVRPDALPQFERLVYANIGNPQKAGQVPVTYIRQLLAALIYPEMLDIPGVAAAQPVDVLRRARRWLKATGGSMGCYSHSKGAPVFREEVAAWLAERDGKACDPESIVLTNGASTAVRFLLQLLLRDKRDGIMIPVPEYPLYTATVTQLSGTVVPYHLDEAGGWALRPDALRHAVKAARGRGVEPRCLVVINPGNPTGAVLNREVLEDIVTFCEEENLLLLADEVYQQNVYAEGCKFLSMRSVVLQRQSPLQVVSLHSASKGLFGECGLRGGCMQLENVGADVLGVLYKLCSVSLCANTIGQATMAAIVAPPKPGDESYTLFHKETQEIWAALKRKALLATKYLNSVEGLSCQPIQGALYAYPKMELPESAQRSAKACGVEPDMLFCMELLETTGIVCVPGSGFGQQPGTWHVRLTILPQEKDYETVLKKFVNFYQEFRRRYEEQMTTTTPSTDAGTDFPPLDVEESTACDDEGSN